jgi:hypothetical protein
MLLQVNASFRQSMTKPGPSRLVTRGRGFNRPPNIPGKGGTSGIGGAKATVAAQDGEEAHAAYAAVTRALVRIATGTGDADSAVRYLLRILGRDPYDEDAHLRLIEILVRQRRYGEASRRHRLYVARMAELSLAAAPYPPST